MSIEEASQPCAHKECRCLVSPGQTYCGPHCANAANEVPDVSTETVCACGHAACNGKSAAQTHARASHS